MNISTGTRRRLVLPEWLIGRKQRAGSHQPTLGEPNTQDLIADHDWNRSAPTPGLTRITYDETEDIEELLLGRSVTTVDDDHLLLDDGTLLKVLPNVGINGGGDYYLTSLADVENIITKVEFDYAPTGDGDDQDQRDEGGYYRIFVFAGDQRINLLQVDGDDGLGYYGTGYSLLVRKT